MTLNEKVDYKTVIECVKVSNIFIGLKKTCLGVLDRGERDKYNEMGWKEGRGIKIETNCSEVFGKRRSGTRMEHCS